MYGFVGKNHYNFCIFDKYAWAFRDFNVSVSKTVSGFL